MDATAAKGSSFGKFLGFLVVVGLIVLTLLLDVRRRSAEKKLQELSVRYEQQTGNPAQAKEVAKQIVEKVGKLIKIQAGTEPTVATIVDVEQLRSRNAFYNKAKNGDHLIVTTDRAILYDPAANIIIDVVPVQLQPPTAAAAGTTTSAKAAIKATK